MIVQFPAAEGNRSQLSNNSNGGVSGAICYGMRQHARLFPALPAKRTIRRRVVASVGLLYVGAVLFINGIMLLGWLDAKSAAPMNFFVGGLQVLTPTYIIFTANGNQDTILAASGLYLFGFTYLYVGINLTAGLDGTGLGLSLIHI